MASSSDYLLFVVLVVTGFHVLHVRCSCGKDGNDGGFGHGVFLIRFHCRDAPVGMHKHFAVYRARALAFLCGPFRLGFVRARCDWFNDGKNAFVQLFVLCVLSD